MPYEKYETKAYLLAENFFGEADKNFKFYTKEFGLIVASGTGIRKLSSKLKGHIDFCEPLSVVLVKGKHVWRLVDVVRSNQKISLPLKRRFMRAVGILSRFVQGEEKNDEIFSLLESYKKFLESDLNEIDIEAGEIAFALKLLDILGYGNLHPDLSIKGDVFTPDSLKEISKNKIRMIGAINKTIKETHL